MSTNPWGGGVGNVMLDGVMVSVGTLPGSWYGGYNLGNNAVHEIGHWLGLSHPFVGGCSQVRQKPRVKPARHMSIRGHDATGRSFAWTFCTVVGPKGVAPQLHVALT